MSRMEERRFATPLPMRFRWLSERQPEEDRRNWEQDLRTCRYEQLLADVRENIERILNTRAPILWDYFLSRESPELNHSLLNYGMNDFCLIAYDDRKNESVFKQSIRLAIERYETRMSVSELTFGNERTPRDHSIQLRIKGRLRIAPHDPLRFQAAVNVGSQKIQVGTAEIRDDSW